MHQQPYRHVEKRGANHTLHIILSVLTCGIWAITGWPIAAAMGRKQVTTTYAPPPQQLPPPQQAHGYPPQQPYGQQQPGPYGQYPPPQQPPPGPYQR